MKWDPFGSVDAFVAINKGAGVPAPRDPRHFSNTSLPHRSPHCDFTHHNVNQVVVGIDKRPDPLAVGLRVDGAGRRADGRTPRALLGVHLHKMKCPKQVLRAATLWEEGVPLKQLPVRIAG